MTRLPPLLLLACVGTTDEPTDTASTDTAATSRMTSVGWECDEDVWVYQVSTEGWADRIALSIFAIDEWEGGPNGGVYAEEHLLVEVAFAEDRSWTRWEASLVPTTRAMQEDGVSTALVCEIDGPEAWAFRVQLSVEDERLDCGIWGQRSAVYFNEALLDDCDCFDQQRGCGTW